MKSGFILLMILFTTLLAAYPSNQPYASYWHPNTLLNWTPEGDPDAPYNRCIVPLQDRTIDPDHIVNPNARPNEGRVANLYISAGTSNNPSQGWTQIEGPAFHFWQYIDLFVFWGGSAGEGLILAPTTDIIAAAHRNGVPILGTIFFPPTAYGGQIQWVNDLLQTDGGTFSVADKLIEVCEYYGFDGWFINQETAGGNASTATSMRDFMIYFQQNSDLELMWYDAMTESGSVSWQEQLNGNNDMFFQYDGQLVSETMFLDFGWNANDLITSQNNADALGRSVYDLYAGVDVQANGYNTSLGWANLFPDDEPHRASLGFYCPSWCYESSSNVQDYFERANRFWVGANRNPANTETTSNWKGVANYIPASTAITELPFVTNFNTGMGDGWALDGEDVSNREWYNRSLQDILPTWQWIVEGNGETLYPQFIFTDGYQGSNCLWISGTSSIENRLRLYRTALPIQSDTHIDITWRYPAMGETSMSIGLTFADQMDSPIDLPIGSAPNNDWQTTGFDLGSYAGRTLAEISFCFGDVNTYHMYIGQIRIYNGEISQPAAPTNVVIDSKAEDELDEASIRVSWVGSTDDVQTYHVYRIKPDGNRQFLWGCCSDACFLPEINRLGDELHTTLEVYAIGKDGGRSEPATVQFDWNAGLPPEQASTPNPANGDTTAFTNCLLLWGPSPNADSYDVYFGTSEEMVQVVNTANAYYEPQNELDPNTQYYWRVDPVNEQATTLGETWTFTTTEGNLGIFTNHADIGDVSTPGSVSYLDGVYTVTASGSDIWNSSDEFHYVFKKFRGDTQFNIRCTSVESEDDWTKAGIMMRTDWSDPGSAFAIAMQITDNHVTLQYRTEDGESASWIGYTTGGTSGPKWLYLRRIGNNIRAYYSEGEDPVPFDELILMGDIDIPGMDYEAYAGIALNAHDDSIVAEAVFDNVTIAEDIANDPDAPVYEDQLLQNYPNPFNPETSIEFELKQESRVKLHIYNVRGQRVRTIVDDRLEAGRHTLLWRGDDEVGSDVASGVYLYRLSIDGRTLPIRKCLLIK